MSPIRLSWTVPAARQGPAMTANATPDDRQRCQEAGMDGFLAKPVSTRHLYDLLEGLRS